MEKQETFQKMTGCRINKEIKGICAITKGTCQREECPTWYEYIPSHHRYPPLGIDKVSNNTDEV